MPPFCHHSTLHNQLSCTCGSSETQLGIIISTGLLGIRMGLTGTEWKKIFAAHVFDKELVPTIYKEL